MAKTKKITIGKILLLGLALRIILLVFSGFHPDLLNHIDWGIRFLSLGPKKFYENIFWGVSWANQPLGSILLFAFMALIKNWLFAFFLFLNNTFSFFPSFIIPILESNLHIWLVKLPFILSDIGLSYLIYKIVNQVNPKKSILAACLFLFNPVLIYNSTVWGQTDSLINLLAILGIYLIFQKKYFPGIILFLSVLLFKLSLIIYIPIVGLLLLKRIKDWKKFILPTISFSIFLFIIAIPFKLDGFGSFQWLWYMYQNRVLPRQGSMLNGNAFNFWALLFSINLSNSEFTKFLGLTYQFLGKLLYIIFLIPVWIKFIKNKLTLTNLLMSLTISAFSCFIFLTNMHERYLYPIFPLITILLFLPQSKITIKQLVLLSIIHFLNLYKLWYYPSIPFLKNILDWNNSITCRFLSLILTVVCFRYYFKFLKSEKI
jgi:Gpi18-like mannosyltransferase